jgi:chaperonin GroEL (HSP60 family)
MVELSKSQDDEIGDGTTGVVSQRSNHRNMQKQLKKHTTAF